MSLPTELQSFKGKAVLFLLQVHNNLTSDEGSWNTFQMNEEISSKKSVSSWVWEEAWALLEADNPTSSFMKLKLILL